MTALRLEIADARSHLDLLVLGGCLIIKHLPRRLPYRISFSFQITVERCGTVRAGYWKTFTDHGVEERKEKSYEGAPGSSRKKAL